MPDISRMNLMFPNEAHIVDTARRLVEHSKACNECKSHSPCEIMPVLILRLDTAVTRTKRR